MWARFARAIVVAAALVFLASSADAAKRVALVIGNDAYLRVPPLTTAKNDAAGVAAALRDIGFQVVEAFDADRRRMSEAIGDFSRQAAGADTAVFFYSGHGFQASGINYLIPVDLTGTTDEHAARQQSLDLSAAIKAAGEARAGLVLLDMMLDNPFAGPNGHSPVAPLPAPGTVIGLSAVPGSVALDAANPGDRHSPYAAALLKHVKAPGIDVLTMLARVQSEVTSVTGGHQMPWHTHSLKGGLYLVPPPAKPAVAATDTPAPLRETRVALVVGNSAYAAVGRLPNAARDAEAIAAALRNVGFDAVTVVNDASHAQLVQALRGFSDQADTADWAVVYFAGHGIEFRGTNYLIPVDARLKTDRDVEFEAVPLPQVLTAVGGARKLRLVVLDACRDNPFAAQMRRTVATRAVTRGLARVEPSGATLVAYAAKDGEVALDGDGRNSPFVSALVKRLDTPGLEISKLFRLVRDDVLRETGNRQEPFVYGSLPGDDFFFKPPQAN